MTTVLVTAAIAPLLAQPAASSTQVSQRVAGHRLTVLEEKDAWLRVRGDDGYEGWVHRGYVGEDDGHPSNGCVPRSDATSSSRHVTVASARRARAR